MFCANCGAENPDTNKFCNQCGLALVGAGPAAEGTVAYPPPEGGAKRPRSRLGRYLALGVAAVVLVAAIVLLVTLLLPRILPEGKQVLLAFPNRNGEADLYLLKVGQEQAKGVRIAENAATTNRSWFYYYRNGEYQSGIGSGYGGFVPDSNRVLFWYQDGDDVVVQEIPVGGKETSTVLAKKAVSIRGALFSHSDTWFLREELADQQRCYVARSGQEAERVAKGDECWVSADGSWLYLKEMDDGETTLSLISMDGKEEKVLLDGVEGVASTRVSDDASHLAYVRQKDAGQQLLVVERSSGAETDVSGEAYSIPQYGFLPHGDALYYLAENDEGMVELYTSASPMLVAEGLTMGAAPSADGQQLVYLVGDEDGEMTVYVHPMQGGQDAAVTSGSGLQFFVVPSPPRILILKSEEGEITLYSAEITGKNLVELFNEDDIALDLVQYVRDQPNLYLRLREQDNTQSVYVTPMDKAGGSRLLDEWAEAVLLNVSADGRQAVFWGREDPGDDPVLYSIAVEEGADPIELDDDHEGFQNAVLDGKWVVYTATTGDNPDDVEVCRVVVDGSKSAEVLYKEATLVDVRWDELQPFGGVYWQGGRGGTSVCPGAPAVQVGETVEGKVEPDGDTCYRFRANEGEVVTFDINSSQDQSFDFELTVFNREGNQIGYNDDGPSGYDPRLTVIMDQSGLYFVKVTGRGGSEAAYTLRVVEGIGEPALSNAQPLQAGVRVRGDITAESAFHIEAWGWDGYGDFYYFDAQAGSTMTVDVYGGSIGSNLDPEVYLLGTQFDYLSSDDDGGDGNDSRLTYVLPGAGRYYVLVHDLSDEYGSPETYYYEVLLTVW